MALRGDTLTPDAPVMHPIDSADGGGSVYKYYVDVGSGADGVVSDVAVQNIRLSARFEPASDGCAWPCVCGTRRPGCAAPSISGIEFLSGCRERGSRARLSTGAASGAVFVPFLAAAATRRRIAWRWTRGIGSAGGSLSEERPSLLSLEKHCCVVNLSVRAKSG